MGNGCRGMVASAFEFADICRKHDYHNFLFSMKASNPLVMVQAYRLLAEEQYKKNWDYPLHLGVTGASDLNSSFCSILRSLSRTGSPFGMVWSEQQGVAW